MTYHQSDDIINQMALSPPPMGNQWQSMSIWYRSSLIISQYIAFDMVNQALPPQINQPEDCVLVKLSSE